MRTFHLASTGSTILLYVIVLLVIVTGVIFVARKRIKSKTTRIVTYIFCGAFVVSLLYPVMTPAWTTVELTATSIRVNGLLFSNEVKFENVDFDRIALLPTLPDSLRTKKRTIGMRFSNLSIGSFELKNRHTALLYETRSYNFVMMPLTDSRYFILTPDKPEQFFAALDSIRLAND